MLATPGGDRHMRMGIVWRRDVDQIDSRIVH
jgi:hypothetical protein